MNWHTRLNLLNDQVSCGKDDSTAAGKDGEQKRNTPFVCKVSGNLNFEWVIRMRRVGDLGRIVCYVQGESHGANALRVYKGPPAVYRD